MSFVHVILNLRYVILCCTCRNRQITFQSFNLYLNPTIGAHTFTSAFASAWAKVCASASVCAIVCDSAAGACERPSVIRLMVLLLVYVIVCVFVL